VPSESFVSGKHFPEIWERCRGRGLRSKTLKRWLEGEEAGRRRNVVLRVRANKRGVKQGQKDWEKGIRSHSMRLFKKN